MEEDREVRLCSVNNSLDAQCIVDLLKENGIASYKKSGIMEIYGGSSIENDIYVSETNYDRAMQIAQEYHMLEEYAEGGYVYVDHGYFTNFYGGGSGLFMS